MKTKLDQFADIPKNPSVDQKVKYGQFLNMENHNREPGGVEVVNGVELPYEWWDIGMVRNAKEEDKKKMKVFLKPAPHVVLDQDVPLRGWYKSKFEEGNVRPRPCFTEALLTQPYGGACPVRCIFCYVNNGIRGYRGQGVTVVDPNYPDKIAKQLDKMKYGWNAYISSFTEPFQKLESLYHNTERLSEAVTSRGLPLFYLTRQIPPDWAVKYLLKSKYSYQQFSIITSDRTAYRRLSPGAAPIDDILKFIKDVLKPQGIYVSIQVNPIILGVVDEDDICNLLRELAAAGANHVIFKFVEIVLSTYKSMIERWYTMFGKEKGSAFERNFTEVTGGMRFIKQEVRLKALRRFFGVAKEVGLTASLCYEYDNKSGQSIGREWCTADQCHGMRTPIHIKGSDGLFHPKDVCPPSGCLYCKETAGPFPPCSVDHLQLATKLKPADYNKDWWMDERQ